MSAELPNRPVVLNPESIGDPDQTPIMQLPPHMAAAFERTRCPECGLINHSHAEVCPLLLPCKVCGVSGVMRSPHGHDVACPCLTGYAIQCDPLCRCKAVPGEQA
jgi:hypothetical protein